MPTRPVVYAKDHSRHPKPMNTPPKAKRCSCSWDIPWKGYATVLKHKHCKRKTNHPSGKCHQHRPNLFLNDYP